MVANAAFSNGKRSDPEQIPQTRHPMGLEEEGRKAGLLLLEFVAVSDDADDMFNHLPENVTPNLACRNCAAKVLAKEWDRQVIKHTPPKGHPRSEAVGPMP